jgi:hypothetical protein
VSSDKKELQNIKGHYQLSNGKHPTRACMGSKQRVKNNKAPFPDKGVISQRKQKNCDVPAPRPKGAFYSHCSNG